MNSVSEIMTKEYLAKLSTLSLSLKGKINTGKEGIRKSGAKGSSLEFSDYREYAHGDDLRKIDWNSFARSGRMHLKLFLEEKQAVINLFIDTSSSMAVGGKGLYAKALSASLAYISLKDTDKVNIIAFGDGITEKKMNLQTKKAFLNAVQFLDSIPIKGGTKLSQTVQDIGKLSIGQGASIIISDFLTDDNWQEAVKKLQFLKQDVTLVWLMAEEELNPTLSGPLSLIDKETGERMETVISPATLLHYKQALYEFENGMREFCKKRGVGFVKLNENIPLLKGLNHVL